MKEFISVVEARSLILGQLTPRPAERVSLGDLLDRTLAEPIRSREPIPPFDNSAMDGFAVQTGDVQDGPVTLRVVEDIPAGVFPLKRVIPGTCARIMTGAPIPDGADAVVPIEWTVPAGGEEVRIERAPEAGQYVRKAGRDVKQGELVFEPGEVVTPPVVGMLAKLGYAAAAVTVPPRVAVVATGDELVSPAETLQRGQIRDSNGPALAAQARSAGAEVLSPLHAPDDRSAIRRTVEHALEADVVLFSGGVSVGDYDFVKDVLDEMGMELIFWKVRQRPGKPLAFGTLDGRLIFGLPGNPVSSAICFEQYVRPTLAKLLGRRELLRPRHAARLDVPIRKQPGLHHFVRGVAFYNDEGCLSVRATGDQASNLYSSVVRASCIIHLPEALEDPPAGTLVHMEWLPWC